MTATREAPHEQRHQPTAAVVTSDGASWSWPDLFAQFAPAIHSFARSRGASSPDDIVQDVFATAVERFPRFSGDSSGLRSFLFTLAYRRVADEHRVRYRRQEQLVADHEPTAEVSAGVEDSITEMESANEAMQALEILSERERRIIEMRIIEEASPAEVADALGLSNGNVRVIQARALLKIRRYLEGRSGALPSFGLAFTFIKGLRSELSTRGGLGEWIEILHAESVRGTAKTAVAGAGSAIAAGATSTGSVGAIAGSVLKIGLVLALATATTSEIDTSDQNAQGLPGADEPAAVVAENATPAGSTEPEAAVDEPTPSSAVAPIAPYRPTIVTPSTPATEQSTEDADSAGPDTEAADPDGGGTESVVGDVVEPVVGGVVEPLVEDVGDTVETVVNDVVDTVDTVAEDVVQPVVATVVDVVDDTPDTVDDTVDIAVDVVDDTVDTVDTAVGGIVGGLGGLTGS